MESDFQVNVTRAGLMGPQRVEVVHRPTGFIGIAEDRSQLKAREKAFAALGDMVELADTVASKAAA